MIETLSVSLSGPAFSFLLYENMKSTFAQEGFLLGEIVEKETRSITDNDQRQVHVSRVVKINSVVPCPQICYFYDGIGRVDTDKIKTFLGDLTTKVVAWYKYRPASSFNFTFRERIVHTQLVNLFDLAPEYFTCCLLISESSDNGSTHSFTQNFVRYHNHGYEQLPLHIVNLSDPNNTYKRPERVSDTFLSVLEGLNINHKKSQGLNIITKIENALQKQTSEVLVKLSEAEKKLFQLESDIKKINEFVKKKDLSGASDNKKSQLNDFFMMDVDSSEANQENNTLNEANQENNTLNEANELTLRRSTRGKAKTPVKPEKRGSQSPVKKNNSPREINTRSKKRN